VKQRKITWNPCTGIKLEPEAPTERQRWTAEEAATFIAAAVDDPIGLMFRIAVLRGARRGELCRFRWSTPGTDLDRGVLIVERPILQLGGKIAESRAKTAAGARKVFLDRDTAQLVRQHHDAQVLQALQAEAAWQDNDLIFCQPDGRPWNPDYVTRRFKRLAAQAGVRVLTLHEGGRHTGNSLMRDADVDQELRMREVGHSNKSVNDRYTHPLEEAHLAGAEQVAALVRKAGGESWSARTF
jgi:integrase